jgi:hypothetical protein
LELPRQSKYGSEELFRLLHRHFPFCCAYKTKLRSIPNSSGTDSLARMIGQPAQKPQGLDLEKRPGQILV